tara:strand:+ start:682 stop:1536 length:855 start_codon:yes stop_codon:yes gene_type:complete
MDKKRYTLILLFGMIFGAVLAAISIVEESSVSNYQWAAKIEDTIIPMDKYLMQLEGLAKDKRSPLTQNDEMYVLERMIEEELLIKRAIDLGMLENNPMARGTIVQQMIKTIISENDRYEIPDQDLINFFEENIGFFTKSQRLRLQQIYFSNEEFSNSSQKKAQEAYEMLIDGEAFSKVSNLGSKSALRIPNTLMTLSKVREYIGPSLMNLARNLEAGSFSEPVAVSGGYKIIYLFEKELIEPPSFRSIEDSVRAEYSKRMDDKSLRDYLENLKNWYDISRNPPK